VWSASLEEEQALTKGAVKCQAGTSFYSFWSVGKEEDPT